MNDEHKTSVDSGPLSVSEKTFRNGQMMKSRPPSFAVGCPSVENGLPQQMNGEQREDACGQLKTVVRKGQRTTDNGGLVFIIHRSSFLPRYVD